MCVAHIQLFFWWYVHLQVQLSHDLVHGLDIDKLCKVLCESAPFCLLGIYR